MHKLRQLLHHEAAGGVLLSLAAFVAIVLVNFGFSGGYHDILDQRVKLGVGTLVLDKSLHHFINDGLMAVFFFLVGLEIKREVLKGNLSDPSQIVLPAAAAVGGIVVPALLYWFFTAGSPGAIAGWAIPTATDIAFALGALALVGRRAPISLKIFLLTLATFDDLAAIVIIATFYASGISAFALGGAFSCLAVLIALNRLGNTRIGIYILLGLVMWVFVLKSGIHATLAGVALGLTIPLHRKDGTSPLHDIEHALQPYVKFLILPLFAFANAGLPLADVTLSSLMQGVPLGIAAGLVLGKPFGILLVVGALVLTRLAKLPQGANWRQVIGVSCLAGIGFTMSLFIGSLAFSDAAMESQVRLGVIAGSLTSMALGLLLLLIGPKQA